MNRFVHRLGTDISQLEQTIQRPRSEKQERAERMIGEVVCAHEPLKAHGVIIIPQGSYRNNTNVRQESDVDICVCCTEPFFADYEYADYGDELTGLETAQYSSPTSRTMLRTR